MHWIIQVKFICVAQYQHNILKCITVPNPAQALYDNKPPTPNIII